MAKQGALKGDKVILRPFLQGGGLEEDELRRQYEWDQDREIRRLSGLPKRETTFIEFRHFWEGERRRPSASRIVHAIYTAEGELIGRISCSGISRSAGQGELGVVIGERSYWGRGYGRDAIRTFLRYLFGEVGLKTVSLFTFVDNLRAQRCFRACGFKTLGRRSRVTLELDKQEGIDMAITAGAFFRLEEERTRGNSMTGGEDDRS